MKYKILSWFVGLVLGIAPIANSQTMLPLSEKLMALKPVNIFSKKAATEYVFTQKPNETTQSIFTSNADNASNPIFTAEIFAATKSHYDIQAIWKSDAAVKKGDVLLTRFAIKSIYAKQESGDAVLYFYVQSADNFEKSIITEINAGPEWKTMDIPFVALNDFAVGKASICFSFGALAQKVEIANIQVLNFEKKIKLTQLPTTKFTYKGREENSAWRNEALQRIEDIRTAPIKINVIDKNGNAVKGAKAQIKLVEQEFIWGTAANEALLGNNLPNSKNYRKYLKEFFNTAIIENGFKAGTWQDKPFRKAETMRAFNWIQQNGFRQRGHNAVWPGWKFNSKLFKTTAETDTAKFRLMIEEDVRSKMLAIKGKVIAWDVINEPIHERNFQKYLPADIEVQWFKLAKEIDPLALLFINEYGMLNSIASPAFIRSYIDTIIRLRNSGAPIEAIGIQGHVGRQPRSPSQVISDLDMFKPLGLPVQITEFDINMTDEQLQADYTRDFLIACYSHPTITGFNIWGFWQGAHWKPDAAMFTNNWTEKLNAAVWREWVTKKWKTNITVTTNKMGMVNNKGHLGNYEVLINYKGKSKKVNYQLTKKSQPLVITIN